MPIFEYSDEVKESDLFVKLGKVVQQENLDSTVQASIFKEFKTINQTAETLNVLKVIMNYAKTTLPDPDTTLADFMQTIYIESSATATATAASSTLSTADSVKESALTTNIADNCQLKHLKHLWLVLLARKAFLYTVNNLDAFENLSDVFKAVGNSSHDLQTTPNPTVTLSLALVVFQLMEHYARDQADEKVLASSANMKYIFFLQQTLSINL
jgi:hypothetical protein